MPDFIAAFDQMRGIPLGVLGAVLSVAVLFLIFYLPRAMLLGFQLNRSARRVAALRRPGVHVQPEDVARILARQPYQRLWFEYEETLHRVALAGTTGEQAPGAASYELRTTVPAGALFTRESLVDSRLFDEFVRHLPGVLTGLGIIGTFAGLLTGLQGFNPSEDPSLARLGLKVLLGGVEQAFYASAVAIGCAILITLIEKLLIARCYLGVDALAQAIDSLFAGGAGEDYLARLVRVSEDNARENAGMKEALASELKAALNAFGERQVALQRQQIEAMGSQLARAVGEGLALPMRELVAAVQAGPAATGARRLEDVVAALASRLTETVESVLAKGAAQQESVNEQTRSVIDEIKRQAREQHDHSDLTMRTTVSTVLAEVSSAVAALASERQAASDLQWERQGQFDTNIARAYAGLSTEVGRLLGRVAESAERTEAQIAAIQQVSLQGVKGLDHGVQAMNAAAQQFSVAGQAVAATVVRAADTSDRMAATTQALQNVCETVDQAFARYESARAGIESQIASLGSLIENAKKDAGLNKELLADMQGSVQSLRSVQQASSRHLEEVNEKLVVAFEAFGDSMKTQVASVMKQTDHHTSTAMQHLLGVVQELGYALSRAKHA